MLSMCPYGRAIFCYTLGIITGREFYFTWADRMWEDNVAGFMIQVANSNL